ncbi:hypothetical protein DPMN_132523 [Dreissena polymorpha]|uniref:EGF-like domain-containing protein n=1 Tax=Dreissena polymorpha TaxID=45954 RepID=A0A9D4FU12_DREPO|nr:hypothetical protein DPMN_132523 [Dreissena polymorpha]
MWSTVVFVYVICIQIPTTFSADPNCDGDMFNCGDGQCISKEWQCDGAGDCLDDSDEHNCDGFNDCTENEFRCSNNLCIAKILHCDHNNDCTDGSDEQNCQVDVDDYNEYGHCNEHCDTCDMGGNCKMCKEGWFGEADEVSGEFALICDQTCPATCKFGHCDGHTGYCKDGCKHGYYGKRCEDNCKQICVYEDCDLFGNCTIGCKAGTFGPKCAEYCPQRCKDKLCDVVNGSCSKGCADNFYGSHCNITCPKTCNTVAVGPSCHAESGSCLAGCLNGFYGERCSDVCQHCVNNTCQKDDGVCVHGCIMGYRLDVYARTCLYGLQDNNVDKMAQTAKPLPVYAVVAIAVGCVVLVVIVVIMIIRRYRRRNTSRSSEMLGGIPMEAVANATYETCQEPSDRIYTTTDGSEEVGVGRGDDLAYKFNGKAYLKNSLPKEKKTMKYKRSNDLIGNDKHQSNYETPAPAFDETGYISPIAELFHGDDGYEVPSPSTSGRNAVDENDTNIYSEPDECCFIGPNDPID